MDPKISEELQHMHNLDQIIIKFNNINAELDKADPNVMQNYWGVTDEKLILSKYLHICRFNYNSKTMVCEKTGRSFDTCEEKGDNFGWGDALVYADLKTKEKVVKPFKLAELSAVAAVKAESFKRLDTVTLFYLYNTLYGKEITVRAGDNRFRGTYDVLTIIRHHLYKKNGLSRLVPEIYFQNIRTNVTPCCVKCSLAHQYDTCFCVICQFFDCVKRCTDLLEKNGHTNFCN